MDSSLSERRQVSSHLTFEVSDPTAFVLALTVARSVPLAAESLEVRLGDELLTLREIDDPHGTRLQEFVALPGILTVDYSAEIVGRAAALPVEPADVIRYLRPSRYAQSDALTMFARETFAPEAAGTLVREVVDWVAARLEYVAEATSPTGGAVETLATGAGVCRDYAHLTIALLRALDVPARQVSVYAPGLSPMDFHAVVEALVDGRWIAVDATRLAPRMSMVRMATGRDSADTAFEMNTRADVDLLALEVTATSEDFVPEDPTLLVELG